MKVRGILLGTTLAIFDMKLCEPILWSMEKAGGRSIQKDRAYNKIEGEARHGLQNEACLSSSRRADESMKHLPELFEMPKTRKNEEVLWGIEAAWTRLGGGLEGNI